MSQQDPRAAQRMTERYAAQPSAWPKVFLVLGIALVVLLAGWLAWAVWIHSTPKVTSGTPTWEIVDAHTVEVRLPVSLGADAANPRCLVRAYAEDHTVVGDASFAPENGSNDVSIRTERLATSVEKIGCTADGQNDAR